MGLLGLFGVGDPVENTTTAIANSIARRYKTCNGNVDGIKDMYIRDFSKNMRNPSRSSKALFAMEAIHHTTTLSQIGILNALVFATDDYSEDPFTGFKKMSEELGQLVVRKVQSHGIKDSI